MSNDNKNLPFLGFELPAFAQELSVDFVNYINKGSNLIEINERHGSFKDINSDWDAINLWLHNQYRDKVKTKRVYEKEMTRFMLWACLQQKKAFSDLDEHDVEAYFNFILDPQPREIWCLKDPNQRPVKGSPEWRPFAGPIQTVTSYKLTHAVLSTSFKYLKKVKYLKMNPFDLIEIPAFKVSDSHRKHEVHQRILSATEWNTIVNCMLKLPEHTEELRQEKARLRFTVTTLFFLGLRVEELANLKWVRYNIVI